METTKDLLKTIQAIVLDVDGVLTDGTVLITENGDELRQMNVKDGYALQLAIKKGLNIWVISGGNSKGVKQRLNRLGVSEVFLEIKDKIPCLQSLLNKYQVDWNQIAYMGDDIPDVEPMKKVLIAACPSDAVPEVKIVSQIITAQNGGKGCVRALIEQCLRAKKLWESAELASN